MKFFYCTVTAFLFLLLSSCAPSIPATPLPDPLAAAHLVPGHIMITSGTGITKGSVDVSTIILNKTNVGMARFNDPWGSKEVEIDLGSYDQMTAFGGQNGSMTLVADTINYPLTGGAYPVLTSFRVENGSGITEFINLAPACQSAGMWTCSGGLCDANPSCAPATTGTGSSFANRSDWDQHQVPPYGYTTTNTFPRCDPSVSGWTNCPASAGGGALVSGHYYAKFLLLSDAGSSVANTHANLRVNVAIKRDTVARDIASTNGGLSINLILVGDKNVNDSHTAKGARNLNLLFKEVDRIFSALSGAKLGVSSVKVYEWTNTNGGSQYSQVEIDSLGNLFEAGSKGVDPIDNGKNINIFLVSDITKTGATFTILGLSGAILGPPMNGTQVSGLAFSSSDNLAVFNPSCTIDNCARTLQQNDFLEMGATIAHEIGHYLGLNHPSESPDKTLNNGGSQTQDQLPDTPTALRRTYLDSNGNTNYILDQRACFVTDTAVQAAPFSSSCQTACNAATGGGASAYLSGLKSTLAIDPWTSYGNPDMPAKFCAAVQECQFNHIMWYTTKNRRLTKAGSLTCSTADAIAGICTWGEDGNLFSPQSSAMLQWDPFIR